MIHFKGLKEKTVNSKLITSENILSSDCSVKNESEVTFLNVEKLKECVISRPAVKEMLKKIIQWKGNDIRGLRERERLVKWEYKNKCIVNMKKILEINGDIDCTTRYLMTLSYMLKNGSDSKFCVIGILSQFKKILIE